MGDIEIRPCVKEDGPLLAQWCLDPETEPLMPPGEPKEIEDSAVRWAELGVDQKCGLTALYKGTPVGFGLLFLQTYKRLVHQCMYVMVVDRAYRSMGIGGELLKALETLAKESGVELIHVEVYEDEAIERFFRKRGYRMFAKQEKWTKRPDGTYRSRIHLERFI